MFPGSEKGSLEFILKKKKKEKETLSDLLMRLFFLPKSQIIKIRKIEIVIYTFNGICQDVSPASSSISQVAQMPSPCRRQLQ